MALHRALGRSETDSSDRSTVSLRAALSLTELAQAIGADASYTTIIVNELQALGLLSRTPDVGDRRRKTEKLTAKGA